MSKKLLSEAQMRRFAKLANLESVTEAAALGKVATGMALGSAMNKRDEDEEWGGNKHDFKRRKGKKIGDVDGHYKDYEMNEDAEEEIAADAAEAGMDELPAPDEAELDDMGGEEVEDIDVESGPLDQEVAEDIAGELISAIGDVLGVEIEMSDAPEVVDDVDIEDEMGVPDVGGEEEIVDDVEVEDEEIMEALRGINYVPGRKEIVNEVAKRVAKRLLKAKQAEQQLQEALGNTPRRTTKKPVRKTTNARRRVRRTKK